MNKLVIVGNGFDLAHGLPTSYSHFMDSFWSNLINSFEDELTKELVYVNPEYIGLIDKRHKDLKALLENFEYQSKRNGYRYNKSSLKITTQNHWGDVITAFEFKNQFFKEISLKSIKNWVDIENEYYVRLKTISKRKSLSKTANKEKANLEQSKKNVDDVFILNEEFRQVKQLLENYLLKNILEKKNLITPPENQGVLLDYFDIDFFFEMQESKNTSWLQFISEFPNYEVDSLIDFKINLTKAFVDFQEGKINEDEFKSEGHNVLFLNFNYTNSLLSYIMKINEQVYQKAKEIKIHGALNDPMNSMNFGFGDEMDGDYKYLENLNHNEYLKNFKSFKYSQNSNYKELLDFIDSKDFQLYIMGHSCGLSDRTLLNTIFEHKNCRSIKVFYHQREDGSDNFTEIIQNISRHFNNKKMMREIVVNKSLCSPLPQNIRFENI